MRRALREATKRPAGTLKELQVSRCFTWWQRESQVLCWCRISGIVRWDQKYVFWGGIPLILNTKRSAHQQKRNLPTINPGGGSIMLMLFCSRPQRAWEGGGSNECSKKSTVKSWREACCSLQLGRRFSSSEDNNNPKHEAEKQQCSCLGVAESESSQEFVAVLGHCCGLVQLNLLAWTVLQRRLGGNFAFCPNVIKADRDQSAWIKSYHCCQPKSASAKLLDGCEDKYLV